MIAWFTRNSVAANLLMISIVMAGLYSLKNNIPLEIFPSFQSDMISIQMTLRGATPEDVEKGISIRIEEAVQDLEGIKKITSNSREGGAAVIIEVESGYDAREMLADIKSRVDAINSFPIDAEKPVISLAQRKREVIVVTIASDYSEKETLEYAENIRDELLRIPDITQINLDGIRNYEIAIEISQDRLRQYDLTISQIASAIRNSSLDISSGNLKSSGGDILIRSKGQAYRKDDFSNIVIKNNPDGSIIRLGDIAMVLDDFEETPVRTSFNGKKSAFIEVYRIGDQSAIDVADKVKDYIKRKQPDLPTGFELSYWDDDSEIVKKRLETLSGNAIQGGILVLVLLTLFLRPTIAFWVFIGIPVSFMGAFLIMPFFGVTLNVLSLFGFILVLGIVVDDAIVTGENIYTHLRSSESGEMAAIRGTQEVAIPVTFGVLTTVVAFLPLAFIEGQRSVLFAQIPVVVIPVLLFSLIESKFVLPAHLKHIKLRQKGDGRNRFEKFQQKFADGFEKGILIYYRPLLERALRHKRVTTSLYFSVFLVIVAIVISGWTPFVFFPRIPSETIRLSLTMPVGTPFEVTNQHVIHITDQARSLKEKYRDPESGKSIILNILSTTGDQGGASNEGRVRFEIIPPEERLSDISVNELANEWRTMIGQIPGAENLTLRAEIGRTSDPIDIQMSSNSIESLEKIAEQIKDHLRTYPTVFEIADSMSDGKEELQIELTEQGRALGLTRNSIANQVREAFFGAQAQRIQRGRNDVRVMVRLPLEERRSYSTLQNLLIQTPEGGTVPLSHVATLTPGQSPSTIRRIDRYRTINVTADIDKSNTNMTVLQGELDQYLSNLVTQYPGVKYSLEGEANEQRESIGSLVWALALVFFVIYILLAIPFKSYLQPLVVMSIIPYGIIGAIIGHWIMGSSLTIMSLMGMLALIGIAVNDSLVLVDYINKKRLEEGKLLNAILTAGVARFRPVFLTSATTFIGLMPLLFEKSTQAQFLKPMAISLGFGILFTTVITLILVPVNYMILEQIKRSIFKRFKGDKKAEIQEY